MTASTRPLMLGLAMLLAAAAAWYFTPRATNAQGVMPLAQVVPRQFAEWRELDAPVDAIDPRGQRPGETDPEAPYDDVLMRSYVNARGDVVMLALAYGRHQRQEVKIHRPELCYTSQGYSILQQSNATLALSAQPAGAGAVQGARMLVSAPGRSEAVSYWIRIGNLYSTNAWKTRAHIFAEGMQGRVVDGMLVRVSQIVPDAAAAGAARYEVQERFLGDLVHAMPADARRLLIGGDAT
jgi:EpsI family protein